jgi:hypothetical protein
MRIPLLLGLLAVAGCGEVEVLPDAPPEAPPAYLGVWQVTSGDLWQGSYGVPRFLELDADGGGALRTRFEPSGVLGCGLNLLHAPVVDGTFFLDINGQRLFQYEVPDANTLVIRDHSGGSLMLERTAEVPASAKCSELEIAQQVHDVHVQLGSFTGLGIKSSSQLWVTNSSGALISIDPSTGTATPAPTPAGGYEHIQAFEGSNFWAHCGCGGSSDIALRTSDAMGTQVDLVDTESFAATISIRAAAVDGTTLWLGGSDGSGYRLLKFTRTSPTVHALSENVAFSNLQSIAAINGKLWAIVGGTSAVLVSIDPTTMSATATYALPADVSWKAIGGANGSLWLVGTESDGDVGLIRVTPQ